MASFLKITSSRHQEWLNHVKLPYTLRGQIAIAYRIGGNNNKKLDTISLVISLKSGNISGYVFKTVVAKFCMILPIVKHSGVQMETSGDNILASSATRSSGQKRE